MRESGGHRPVHPDDELAMRDEPRYGDRETEMAIEMKDEQAQAPQEACGGMELPKQRPEHVWLQRLVGEWTYEMDAPYGEDKTPTKFTGTESIRAVGDFWITGEGTGYSPDGSPATMSMTLGFDPSQGGYVGTWYGSMVTYLWVYRGSMDADQRVLTLACDGPSFEVEGKLTKYKDIITIVSDDERILTGNYLGEDGEWHEMCKMLYRRA
jgi:hypothetical protein